MNKRCAWALLISLALNLFLGGFVVARGLRHQRHGGHGPDPSLRLLRAVTASGNADAERMLRAEFANFAPRRRALRQAKVELKQAVTAEPLAPEAVDRALARLRAETAHGQQEVHELIAKVLPQLTLEQRLQLFERQGGERRR